MAKLEDTATDSSRKFLAFSIPTLKWMDIAPASPGRNWMGGVGAATDPAVLKANALGWVVLNNEDIELLWNGGKECSDLQISARDAGNVPCADSRLGYGIVTWRLPFIFRTPPGFDLRIRGPVNSSKDGVFPLESVVQSDSEITGATISWKIVRIGTPIRFARGEPLCMLYPEERGLIEQIEPEIHRLDEDPNLSARFSALGEVPKAFSHTDLERRSGKVAAPPEGVLHGFKDLRPPSTVTRPVPEQWESTPAEARARTLEVPLSSEFSAHDAPFLAERDFYDQTYALREQFESYASRSMSSQTSENPLAYIYSPNACQYMTATVEQIFARDVVFNFVDRVRAWARQTVGASHVSTPQLRLYINGCWRGIMRDDVNAKWHYFLSLARNPKHKLCKVKIVVDSSADLESRVVLAVGRVASTKLDFGEFLIHDIKSPYGIDDVPRSMNPLEGAVFLEGYIW